MHRPSAAPSLAAARSCCSTPSSSLFCASALPSGPAFSMRSSLRRSRQMIRED